MTKQPAVLNADGTPTLDVVHCMDALELLRALPDGCVDMILTDMPYGTTACVWDTVIDLDAWWLEAHRVAKERAAIVCTGSQPFTSRLIMSNIERFRYEWIWDKTMVTGAFHANSQPMKGHENVMVFGTSPQFYPIKEKRTLLEKKRDSVGNYTRTAFMIYGGIEIKGRSRTDRDYKFPSSLIRINALQATEKERVDHPTQKPVSLFEYLIRTYTQPGEMVLDPFVGSGTAAIAARNTGRHYICGDTDEGYVQIARDRLALPYTPDMFDTLLAHEPEQAQQMEMEL